MKKFASAALVSAVALTLAACGSSDSASEGASAENVEMPAEEAMSGVDPAATPAAEAPAAAGSEAAATASEAAPAASAAAGDAAEKATADAEKKM